MEILGKSIVADAVDNAEVHGLRLAAQIRRDRFHRHAEDLGRRSRMNILPVQECFQKVLVLRKMREDAQLDLRVIGGHKGVIAVARFKERTDLSSLFRTHGNVLQIRL